jgi:prepilin-type N-terminal cleavage/methylation domain-containing protein
MGLFLNKDKKKGGFTLIEILISISILSIVLAAIYSTFFLTHKAVTWMDKTVLKIQEARKAIDILRRELDSVYYYSNDKNTFLKIETQDVYGKQAAQISFTTFSILKPGISKISYYIEYKDGKLNLFKKIESPYFNKNNPHSETQGVEIIEGLEAFTVEALYNGRWVKTWDTEINKGIPDEIRISLSFKMQNTLMTLFDLSRPKIGRSI